MKVLWQSAMWWESITFGLKIGCQGLKSAKTAQNRQTVKFVDVDVIKCQTTTTKKVLVVFNSQVTRRSATLPRRIAVNCTHATLYNSPHQHRARLSCLLGGRLGSLVLLDAWQRLGGGLAAAWRRLGGGLVGGLAGGLAAWWQWQRQWQRQQILDPQARIIPETQFDSQEL